MRTTLTLDSDVAFLVEDAMKREHRSFKEVVNDALRRGLGPSFAHDSPRYAVVPHATTLLPGVDPAGFNQLVDELEIDATVGRDRP